MRRLWAQLAALGVGRVLLTNAERVERHYFDTHMLAPAHYRPLLLEGLQQARDTRVPVVSVHKQLKVLVEDDLDRLCPDTTRVIADPGAGSTLEATLAAADRSRRTLLAVGPEGGWNDFERGLFARHGFQAVSMGPRTLRTDTACVALLARVHASRGSEGLSTDNAR
jgi:RsmE family RNA methyltransferase